MIEKFEPLYSEQTLNEFLDCMEKFLLFEESFRFLSKPLVKFGRNEIEEFTLKHKEFGIDYYVFRDEGAIRGVMALKESKFWGFEAHLLVVDPEYRRKGICGSLLLKAEEIARAGGFRCIEANVFADNKGMLRLLINHDYLPAEILTKKRADGMDMLRLCKYLKR